MSRILVLDDDPHILRTLEILLQGEGHEVVRAESAETALGLLEHRAVDIALVDLQLPGMPGLEFLHKLRDQYPDVEAVIITAHGTVETAVEAMKEGAHDYLTKPFSPDQVRRLLRGLERVNRLKAEVSGLKRKLGDDGDAGFLTRSPAVRSALSLARNAGRSDVAILITGESGTGKNLLARIVHDASPRRDGPFVLVDCAAFQETLLESELFGHTRGAFTGAVSDKPGKAETAQGGTLFLDEVGEIPLSLQGKLLRLVEEKAFERLGDPAPRSVDARIVAASNRNLEDMVREKTFRQDLFYRLSVVEVFLPALRARPEDVLPLAELFVREFNSLHGRKVEALEEAVERLLLSYSWPGNVRELSHVLERAVLQCPGRVLRPDHLPPRLLAPPPGASAGAPVPTLAELEENHIRAVLARDLPLEDAARLLGIDPSTLWRKRKKYGI